MIQQSHFWECIQETKSLSWDICTPLFTALFTIMPRNNLGAHWQTSRERKCGVYIRWSIIQPQKRESCHLWQREYTLTVFQQVKLSQRQILYHLTYMWDLQTSNSQKQSNMVAARGWAVRQMGSSWSKGTNSVIRWVSSRDLTYRMVTMVNDTVLYTWELPWEKILNVLAPTTTTTKLQLCEVKNTNCGNKCSAVYPCSQRSLYTFNLRNVRQAHLASLLAFTSLPRYCVFYKLEVCGNPVSSKSNGAIFPTAHFVSLEVSRFGNSRRSPSFSLLSYLLWWSPFYHLPLTSQHIPIWILSTVTATCVESPMTAITLNA